MMSQAMTENQKELKTIKLSIREKISSFARKFFRKSKSSVVIDRSQLFELERIQMENWPSVREFEMALEEFERTRCKLTP